MGENGENGKGNGKTDKAPAFPAFKVGDKELGDHEWRALTKYSMFKNPTVAIMQMRTDGIEEDLAEAVVRWRVEAEAWLRWYADRRDKQFAAVLKSALDSGLVKGGPARQLELWFHTVRANMIEGRKLATKEDVSEIFGKLFNKNATSWLEYMFKAQTGADLQRVNALENLVADAVASHVAAQRVLARWAKEVTDAILCKRLFRKPRLPAPPTFSDFQKETLLVIQEYEKKQEVSLDAQSPSGDDTAKEMKHGEEKNTADPQGDGVDSAGVGGVGEPPAAGGKAPEGVAPAHPPVAD